jgi:hypothetical protein
MYIYSLQVRAIDPTAASATGPDAATIAGVKNDLIAIANVERAYQANEGKYASLDELASGNYLTIKRERPPYVYDVELSSSGFRATATRTTKGAPAQLWITDSMEVQTSD